MFVKFQSLNSKFCKEVVNCSCPVQHQVACMQQLHSNCHKSLHFPCLELPHGWLPCLEKICDKFLRLCSVNCPSKLPFHPSFGSFLDHVEKLLGKMTIEIMVCDLSYDQIKNLVLRRDTRYVYSQFLNGIYFLDQRRS